MDDVAMQQKDPENRTDQKKAPHSVTKEQMANHHNVSDDPASDGNCDDQGNIDSKMIDLNMRPSVLMDKVQTHRLRAWMLASTIMILQEWCQHVISNEKPTNKYRNTRMYTSSVAAI